MDEILSFVSVIMKGNLMAKQKRLCYLDFLRIVACFLVVLNHTPGYIASFNEDPSKPLILIIWHLFVEMVVKIGVPIFFMISGSLLLRKDMSYKDVFKRILKMFLILLGFSIIANIAAVGHLYIPGFIRNFASATVDGAGPYWYLYTYIGFLLIFPFMRSVAIRLQKEDVIYLIVARFIITGMIAMCIIFLNIIFDSNMYITDKFEPAFITVDCLFYTLVGFGLDSLFDIKWFCGKREIVLAAVFASTALLESGITWIAGIDNVFSGLDFLMTISLFMLVKASFERKEPSERCRNAIILVGSLTFGIYLLDPVIGNFLKPFVHKLYPAIPSYLGVSMLYCIVSMVVCGIMTFVYKRIVFEIRKKK